MQSLRWYGNRLRAMSPQEVWWRLGSKVRELTDYCVAPRRRRPLPLSRISNTNGQSFENCTGVFDSLFEGGVENQPAALAHWKAALVAKADQICHNRLTIFNLEDHHLGEEVRWNYEHEACRQTPLAFAGRIDYRDHDEVGDAKIAWEPSRHQRPWLI